MDLEKVYEYLEPEVRRRVKACVAACAGIPTAQLERRVEPFVVKHYGGDPFPTIKGNGFDGLRIGDDREEAEDFIKWINERLARHGATERSAT